MWNEEDVKRLEQIQGFVQLNYHENPTFETIVRLKRSIRLSNELAASLFVQLPKREALKFLESNE